MQLIDFSQFAKRRTADRQRAHDSVTVTQADEGDRWAQLHTANPEWEIRQTTLPGDAETDFWGDLQFRLAYPTHRLRAH
ncbi:hypothetical protein QEV83_14420 [Methylocapsa sp. D3K7]|uniref:hypothetical protein n=1 Tax=Methylocapsa sp. D3K7 TaxID=3041435 RepID=UPI00244ECCE4|nr:hypothetical protein [Methylocapsa sp. D3K7]WGJ13856.1 hypothetical protein QEV83_14420 [Methylocapsa sp. D3K7]